MGRCPDCGSWGGLTATEPADAPSSFHTLFVTESLYDYDVESPDAGWTLGVPGDHEDLRRQLLELLPDLFSALRIVIAHVHPRLRVVGHDIPFRPALKGADIERDPSCVIRHGLDAQDLLGQLADRTSSSRVVVAGMSRDTDDLQTKLTDATA